MEEILGSIARYRIAHEVKELTREEEASWPSRIGFFTMSWHNALEARHRLELKDGDPVATASKAPTSLSWLPKLPQPPSRIPSHHTGFKRTASVLSQRSGTPAGAEGNDTPTGV